MNSTHVMLAGAIATLIAATPVVHADDTRGAVEQTIPPPVTQNPALPPLHLSDDQRARIRQALNGVNSEVGFQLKSNQPAQAFAPSIGAKIPSGLHPHTLPPPLLADMPVLKRYAYLKFKGQVLIVNPMSRKIVDMFSEAHG
ncbi:MAG: hypothetical protein J2P47_14205 [Acetobacteraceae bacterium]|nr:hypothetical protein [Acetobacteraceae bacterium]